MRKKLPIKYFKLAIFLTALMLILTVSFSAYTQDKPALKAGPAVAAKAATPLAAPGTLKASLQPASAALGATVNLVLTFSLPAGSKFPDKPALDGLSALSITDFKATPGKITISFIADSLTDMTIGVLSMSYTDAKGAQQKLTSDKITLKILTNLDKSPEKQQLKPIQDIMPTDKVWPVLLLWGGLALLIILIIAGIIFFIRHSRAMKKSLETILPPHVRARKALEALDASGLFSKGEIKPYYFRLSEIMKRYLEELRGFPAAEYTTEEIASKVSAPLDRDLVVLLKRTDIVKFADDLPTNSRKEEDVKAALTYIAQSEPHEVLAASEKPSGGEKK